MPSTCCIVVDSREQRPLPFPPFLPITNAAGTLRTVRLEITRRALPTGDYALLGHEEGHVFERKCGLSELHLNLHTPDRARFLRELDRSRIFGRFTLLVEGDLSTAGVGRSDICPVRVRDSLLRLRSTYTHLDFWFVPATTTPQRKRLAEMVAAALILSAEGA